MDLINRQAAINACGNSTFAAEAKWVIEHLPSMEKTGKWVRIVFHTTDGREKVQWCCSECGQSMYQFRQRFCSNCGARMEDENEK